MISSAWLRPDLARVYKVYKAGGSEEASSDLCRLIAEGAGVGYKLPDELPADRTFAYSVAEVIYVDHMGALMVRSAQVDPRCFVLSGVAGLYVMPRPYAFTTPHVALQKSSCSLMRLYAVGFAHHDWVAYRGENEADGRVVPSAALASSLAVRDFAVLPAGVRESFPFLGVHPLLPPILKHHGIACADRQYPAHSRLAFNYEREWAWSVCCAFMSEVCMNRRAFVQPKPTVAFVRRVASGLPDVALHPSEHSSAHVPWTFSHAIDLMGRTSEITPQHHRSWMDYTTGARSAYLPHDPTGDAFVARSPLRPPVIVTA